MGCCFSGEEEAKAQERVVPLKRIALDHYQTSTHRRINKWPTKMLLSSSWAQIQWVLECNRWKKKTSPCCHQNDQLSDVWQTSDTDMGGTCIPLFSTLQICIHNVPGTSLESLLTSRSSGVPRREERVPNKRVALVAPRAQNMWWLGNHLCPIPTEGSYEHCSPSLIQWYRFCDHWMKKVWSWYAWPGRPVLEPIGRLKSYHYFCMC